MRPGKGFLSTLVLCFWLPVSGYAQTETEHNAAAAISSEPVTQTADQSQLVTLKSFAELRNATLQDIKSVNQQISQSQSDSEKQSLKQQLDKLESDLRTITRNFENIAAGVDVSKLTPEQKQEFNFKEEFTALLKPALDEVKEMTAHVRQKSDLKERIAYYEKRLPIIQQALDNVNKLIKKSSDKSVKETLEQTASKWQRELAFMHSEKQAAQLQLEKLVATEVSLSEASQHYLKSFFQKRGLYLTMALMVVLGVLLMAKLSHRAMLRYIPGFRKLHRSFRIRLMELIHLMLTVLLVILGPMIVFYSVEDWVLFSLSILLLLAIAWTLRQTIPVYLRQIQLFLNIGAVREGERVLLDGLPWQVKQINVYCTLINPTADLTQRVPINDLVDLKSRPARSEEPWFPCRKDDWVILNDGVRGKVIGISPEMVQLVERGGAQLTYQTGDFLAKSPRNLATNFRIKETIGISYKLQHESTSTIPETLHGYILQRAEQEGYGEQLLNLRVEFAQANNSSLDLVVIADFKGELGDLYNRLRRAIQRWSVDACSQYAWEIPFPQLTLHGSLGQSE